jgi:tetratricopeptide (TPR) repeat protein
VGVDLDLPDEVFGFGSWLLWVLATRATSVVDAAYAAGPARPSRHYGMVDGHPVPTPSLVAWLLAAAEFEVAPERLGQRDQRLDERQKVLRTIVSRAVSGEPRLFKDGWLRQLAVLCGLGDAELDLLVRCRDDEGYAVNPVALRAAIARTLRSQPGGIGGAGAVLPVGQMVVGEIPREPPGFVARQMLARLAEAAGRGPVAVVCAVTGLRGVGKTQLAAAHARDSVSRGWGLVGWVNAETPGTLLAGLARVAGRLGVADPEGDSLESARRLRDQLQARTAEGLLVFDNATSPDELRPFLPATGGTQVVITSTDQGFTELGEAVDVTAFTRAESLGYLRQRTGLADDQGAATVAHELGDLPLALAQAAATIRRQHLTYPTYLERLRRVPTTTLLGTIPGGDYSRPAAEALLLSIQVTEASDPAGLTGRLLRVVAALSPDGVNCGLLDGLATGEPGHREELVDAAVERCVSGSLLSWSVTGDAVIMHRLLGRVLRERDQADGRWPGTVTAALDLLEPQLFAAHQAWARRDEGAHLAVQSEALWESVAGTGSASPDLRLRALRARCWAVRQLRAAADLSRAADLGTRVLADCERVLGADHPDTLVARDNLAEAYSSGQMEEAVPLHERTLAGRQRVLGADHPDTLSSQEHLATAYQGIGRLDLAIPLYERTLSDLERVVGPDDPDVLISRNDLATAYQAAGRVDDAIPLFERALADRARVLGADHPDTLITQDNLAAAYHAAGRLEQAIPLYERSLADLERVVGPDHPDTLISQNNLARAYHAAGRLEDAIRLFERTLADFERLVGGDHAHTIFSQSNLAAAYRAAGRLQQAIALYEKSLADCLRVLGSEHPQTFKSRDDLGATYAEAGRVQEAIPLFEQTLADRERILGADHPDTLSTRSHLERARTDAKPAEPVNGLERNDQAH